MKEMQSSQKPMRFEAAELLTTGQCPLSCRYCYIPKTEAMKDLHEDIVRSLKDGSFVSHLKKIAGDNLTHLSFWGTEPSLTLKILAEKLDIICKSFPNLGGFSFSTSMVMPDEIIDFARALNPHNKELGIQVSIDGPEIITDRNRFKGAAKKIPENFFYLVERIQNLSIPVKFNWKATISLENMQLMNKDTSVIDEYFLFFDELNKKFKEVNKNDKIILHERSCVPTLVVPGKYTSEDGKEFALFLENLRKKGHESTYPSRLQRLSDFYEELSKKKMFTCSGGDSNVGIGPKVHICHRSFYFEDDRYVKSVLEKKDIDNWDISLFERGAIDLIKKWYAPSIDDEMGKMTFDYVMRGYHDFWPLSIAYTRAMTKELALAGQAEERFLYDEDYLTVFALFVNTGFSCPMESILNTGCIHYTPLSLLRLCGNGAFREILKDL